MTPADFHYEAVSFDVDGTLYSLDHFKVHMALRTPFEIRHWVAMERARQSLRDERELHVAMESAIAQRMAVHLRVSHDEASAVADRLVHERWPWLLTKMSPHRGVRGALELLVDSGVSILAASDYPPKAKINALGLGDLPWKAYLDATSFGALKPRTEVYDAIVEASGTSAQRVLHVGDSILLDICGASAVGMDTVLVGRAAKRESRWTTRPTWAFASVNRFCESVRQALLARSST